MQRTDMSKTERELSSAILRVKPARLVVYCGDADETGKGVAVSKGRNCAQHAMKVVAKFSWTRVDLVDKTGDVLATVDNAEPARELEELPQSRGLQEHALALRIVDIVNKERAEAVKTALEHRNKETQAIVDAATQLVKEHGVAARSIADMYREYGEVAAESADTRAQAEVQAAEAAAASGFDLGKLMEALPVIAQALPLLQKMLGSGEAPEPRVPNGHHKGA